MPEKVTIIEISDSKLLKKSNKETTGGQFAALSFSLDIDILDARFRNPPIGGFKHVECLCGTLWIFSLEKTWFFQLCMIASTLFWSNSMDTFNGPIVLRIHF